MSRGGVRRLRPRKNFSKDFHGFYRTVVSIKSTRHGSWLGRVSRKATRTVEKGKKEDRGCQWVGKREKRRRRSREERDRPPPLVDTDEQACERSWDREGEGRRRRRRHSRLLLQALVRGGGRLGRLEGIPFQTLRIDLFVDGSSSLYPLLIVVDHVLKLFQRFSTGSPRFSIRFLWHDDSTSSLRNRSFLAEHLDQSYGETVYTFDPLTIDRYFNRDIALWPLVLWFRSLLVFYLDHEGWEKSNAKKRKDRCGTMRNTVSPLRGWLPPRKLFNVIYERISLQQRGHVSWWFRNEYLLQELVSTNREIRWHAGADSGEMGRRKTNYPCTGEILSRLGASGQIRITMNGLPVSSEWYAFPSSTSSYREPAGYWRCRTNQWPSPCWYLKDNTQNGANG